jgi:hypothetical protein
VGQQSHRSTCLLLGCYQLRGEVSKRLLAALPTTLMVPAAELDPPLIPLLLAELAKRAPVRTRYSTGSSTGLRRRPAGMVHRDAARQPAWYRAYDDPVVAQALRLLHDETVRPWTVARLAADCGISRAAVPGRFTETVGEAPMTYLTGWRLALAADRWTQARPWSRWLGGRLRHVVSPERRLQAGTRHQPARTPRRVTRTT